MLASSCGAGVDDSNWDASFETVIDTLLRRGTAAAAAVGGGGWGSGSGASWSHVRPAVRRIQHIGSCGAHMRQSSKCVPRVREWPPAIAPHAAALAAAATDAAPEPVAAAATRRQRSGSSWQLRHDDNDGWSNKRGGRSAADPSGGWGDRRDRALCSLLPRMRWYAPPPTTHTTTRRDAMCTRR